MTGNSSGTKDHDTADGIKVTRQDVADFYRALLQRDPESVEVVNRRLNGKFASVGEFLHSFTKSPEFQSRLRPKTASDFFYSTVDAKSLIMRHEKKDRGPVAGKFVNYLGVATRTDYIRRLSHMSGRVEAVPIPSNCHAEMVEWAAALRAVELASGSFTVVELGAGWGCWMVNTAVAAKRLGLRVTAIGVEGDEGHLACICSHCMENGIEQHEYSTQQVVAGSKPGLALFPKMEDSSHSYGQEPKFFDTQSQMEAFLASTTGEKYSSVPVSTLEQITHSVDRVDLLHIDIQGGELELIAQSLPLLERKVAYMVIGTHSRAIDAGLLEILKSAGWKLEFEKPTTFTVAANGDLATTMDGTQGWRNPKLAARIPSPQATDQRAKATLPDFKVSSAAPSGRASDKRPTTSQHALKLVISPGLPRSGTTYLYKQLVAYNAQHFNCGRSKEMNIFARPGLSEEEFKSAFTTADPARAYLDFSPAYLVSRNPAIDHLIDFPAKEKKIILHLRNPVDQFFAHYLHDIKIDSSSSVDRPFSHGAWTSTRALGKYLSFRAPAIERLVKAVGRENIFVLNFHRDLMDPNDLMRRLGAFLTLDLKGFTREKVGPGGWVPRYIYGGAAGAELAVGESIKRVPPRTLVLVNGAESKVWHNVPEAVATPLLDEASTWSAGLSELQFKLLTSVYADDWRRTLDVLGEEESAYDVGTSIDTKPVEFGNDAASKLADISTIKSRISNCPFVSGINP